MSEPQQRTTHFKVWNENEEGRHAFAAYGEPRYNVKAAIGAVDWSRSPVKVHTFIERGRKRERVVQFIAGKSAYERGYTRHREQCPSCAAIFPAPHAAFCIDAPLNRGAR